MTPFLTRNDSNQSSACARSVSNTVSTRLLSSLQVYRVPSLSQQHRQGSHKIQVHTNQHPQVPTFRLVRCPTLPNTISTHFATDEIQRVATKPVFQEHSFSEMMSATTPSQWNVLRPLTLVTSTQRNKTMLRSVTRDQSSRRRALKAASSHKHNQCPYTACNPSASYTRGMVRILCAVHEKCDSVNL